MNDIKTNEHGGTWKGALALFGMVLVGALAGWTGIKGQLDANTRDIQRLEFEVKHQSDQLGRVEDKIDRLLEKRP